MVTNISAFNKDDKDDIQQSTCIPVQCHSDSHSGCKYSNVKEKDKEKFIFPTINKLVHF